MNNKHKIFIRFLKENKAYYAFLKGGFEQRCNIRNSYQLIYLKENSNIDPSDYIDRAFTWSETDEKDNFWCKLHDDWVDFLAHKVF